MLSPAALLALAVNATPCAPHGSLIELEQTARAVSLEVGDGAAVLVLRDTVRRDPAGAGHYATLVMMPGGTAVGAKVEADGATTAASLEDDDVAAERFGAFSTALMTGVPAEEAKGGKRRTALLAELEDGCCSSDTDQVSLEVATTCGADAIVVESTWVVESEPVDGAWRFRVPRHHDLDQRLEVRGASVRRFFVDGARARVIEAGEGDAVIDVVPDAADTLRGRVSLERLTPLGPLSPPPHEEWGKVDGAEVLEPVAPVDTVRVEIDVPRPLADPAPALRVVFVLDASKSAGVEGIAKARAAMEGVLDALPDDARYAAIAFARRPWLVVDPWASPRERFFPEVAPQNGSDLLGALALAHRLAHDVAPEETPRVVVLSDLVQRSADSEVHLGNALERGGVLTHVVALPEDVAVDEPLSWVRVVPDEDPRAEAVEGTGGIFVDLGAGDEPEGLLWPHLVAPTRIDDVSLEVGGRDPLEGAVTSSGEVPAILLAGRGVRVQSVLPVGTRAPSFLTGFLWAQPLALPLDEAAATKRLSLARTAHGPVARELDDEVVRAAAKAVGAVSRVTSLVAVPDYRPQEPDGMGFGMSGCGCGCCGCGCCGGYSGRGITCGIGTAKPIVGELEALQEQLTAAADRCHVPRAAVSIELEDKEILDVVGIFGGDCVVEQAWRWDLQQIAEYGGLEVERVFERRLRLEVRAEATPAEPVEADPVDPEPDDVEGETG